MAIIKYKKSIILILGIFIVIFPIAPISRQPLIVEKPDFLVCLIFSWLILDHKNVSIIILISLSLFADILWFRPLGLWPILIMFGSYLIRYMMSKITLDNYYLKIIYFIVFLFCIDTCIFITSLIGLTEQLDFDIWLNRFIFTVLFFPMFFYLLENLLFKEIKKSNKKI
tara:strand:+ start:850 stop:1356 length:507 start_codon:yes stop_codon:yes gene_type:complete